MAKLHLTASDGALLHVLSGSAEQLLAEAEAHAREHGLAKRSYFPVAVRNVITAAGYHVTDDDLNTSLSQLDAVRRGQQVDAVPIRVSTNKSTGPPPAGSRKEKGMPAKSGPNARFFESERTYPDPRARAWYDRLVGLDDHKRALLLELELLLYPDRLGDWSRKYHGAELRACEIMSSRAPLLLLEGDVGCGKTVLAETVGDALAERTKSRVHLLKLNTQVRGTGMVGEMTDLIVQAFTLAESHADAVRSEPVILLIDEADALAAKRSDQHMHHEDKAGLNTLLQRIDGLRHGKRRMAVAFITNRPDALDSAVRRRAALHLTFSRPNDQIRAAIFQQSLPELDLSSRVIDELVSLTGDAARKRSRAPFTSSDITDRLIPAAMRDAYAQSRRVAAEDLLRHAQAMIPTPAMSEGNSDGQ